MIEQMRIANLAESTQIAYLFEIERLARHYGTSPADIDDEQLRGWVLKLIDRGLLSPSSTNSTLVAFRFLYFETLGCPERVAGLRNRKKPQALPRHMTATEVERLILATPDLRHRAASITAYGAGLRVSETVSVKVGDLKPDRECLHIPSGKGGAERMAPLPDGVIHYLRSYWKNIWTQPANWLFYSASPDEPMRTQALHFAFKKARYKLGIDPRHTFHSLRHSAATHLLERGADIELIRDALGHRSADTTRGYVRQPPDQDEPARPVNDLHQIKEAALHRDMGDVGAPDMVRSLDRQAPEQIGPDPVLGVWIAGVRRPIDRLKPHQAHQTSGPAPPDPHALAAQVKCHPTSA